MKTMIKQGKWEKRKDKRLGNKYIPGLAALLIVLCTLFIGACDLFNSVHEPDYWDKLHEDIAWANADRLTVTVAIPPGWGTSPQIGTNRCFDNKHTSQTPRKAYPFTVEFTPELAYSLDGWRAYYTSSMPTGWISDPGLLDSLERLDGTLVTVPDLPARGGSGSFTINTTLPVTLVPWCKTEPYVLRTTPRHSPETLYPRGTDIVIYFNAPLALTPDVELASLFTTGAISITADGVSISANDDYYNYPVYSASVDRGEYKITISATDVPGDSLIEVSIGPNIFNTSDTPMAREEVFSFGTSPAMVSGNILTWGADYTGSSITVHWTYDPQVEVIARYRVNQGGDNELPLNRTIPNVPMPDVSGVRQGRETSGIREYEIFLDLYVEGIKSNVGSKSFKIWNFATPNPLGGIVSGSGMSVSNTNILTPLDQNTGLEPVRANSSGNFVLVEHISVSSHNPIGTFTGNFYGNGHTVTITGMADAADMGLFGLVQGNALVRDLTVEYKDLVVSSDKTKYLYQTNLGTTGNPNWVETYGKLFGGIAGTTQGTAQLVNVLSRGSITMGGSGFTAYAGGLVGLMTDTSSIYNAYSGLNLTVNTNPGTVDFLYVGGIAGYMEGRDASNPVNVAEISITGNISVGSRAIPVNTRFLRIGGLTGNVSNTIMNNCDYQNGNITIFGGSGIKHIGGGIGHASTGTEIDGCSTSGNFTLTNSLQGVYIGGFVGYLDVGTRINNCFSLTSIELNNLETSTGSVYIGGFGGYIRGAISNCYAKSNINARSSSITYAGGFVGFTNAEGEAIESCYAVGDVSIRQTTGTTTLYIGGFAGYLRMNLQDSYALGNVFVETVTTNTIRAGGLVGQIVNASVSQCFATGSVTVLRENAGPNPGTNAGGLVGDAGAFSVSNSAALGASVMATDRSFTSHNNVGRIFGLGTTEEKFNNRAFSEMNLFNDLYANRANPRNVTSKLTATAEHDNEHGAAATGDTFRRRDIWQNAPPVGIEPSAFHGMGFSTAIWDFSTVAFRGYPVLRGLGGQ